MAYVATGTYNDAELSDSDKALVKQYQAQYNAAKAAGDKAGMDAAHSGAEGVRARYNYSGGADGSEYVSLSKQPEYNGPGNDYSLAEYLKQAQAANTEAELARLQGAYEASMRGYDAQGEQLPAGYNAARNNLAAQNDIAQRNFDERAVAAGLSSGAADQALLSRQNAYVGGLASIDEEQANAQAALDLQKANTTTNYETAIAEARNTGDATLANALYNELVRVQNLEREDREFAKSDAQRAQELALKYGLADPTTIYQINSLQDLANLRTPATDMGTMYTGTTGTGTGDGYDNGGLTNKQIKEMQLYYGANADGLWGTNSRNAAGGLSAKDAWAKYQASKGSTGMADLAGTTGVFTSQLPQNNGRSFDPSKISYSQDEGTFTWNGKIYGNQAKLLSDIENANLNDYQKRQLQKSLAAWGFDINF